MARKQFVQMIDNTVQNTIRTFKRLSPPHGQNQ